MRKNIFSVIILLTSIFLFAVPAAASAPSECDCLQGNNINSQDFTIYGSPVYSYLTKSGSGYMRVQGNLTEDGRSDVYAEGTQEVYAVYYDSAYNRTGWKKIPTELPRFGGFYETEQNYYLVTGQNNPSESDSVEVFRITKYDKNWNRIAACGIFGANTRDPFRSGSCRMDSAGNILAIRTCHRMYKSETDGQNHQASATFLLDMDTMTVLDAQTDSEYSYMAYVGHSFNQFIRIEDNKITAVDQSDVHPRAICLTRSAVNIFEREWDGYPLTQTRILTFADPLMNNLTGASVGGFEITQQG